MKNVFVTGGAGFIGSNFILHLVKHNPNLHIVNYDDLTYAGNLKNLETLPISADYVFAKGNICTGRWVSALLRRHEIDTIINFAAESHVDRSIKNSGLFLQTNVMGTRALLDSALECGVKRFIQIGTDEVYGSLNEDSPSSVETDLLKPRSPYAASKAAADLLALSYFHTHGLPVIVTRSSNNYGAYQYPEKVIPLFITNILQGKKVPVYGKGLNIRDWLHVEDNCEAIRLVAENGVPGEIYNIAGNHEIPNIKLTRLIIQAMGIEAWTGHLVYVEDRKGHDWRYSMNCNKIRNELGWKPQIPFDEGLVNTINWYKENESWWKPLVK
ncbi:MAG: dTDP-glucose 4,6-dehydratase [Candidatus Marinimicrobia bacterium]|nr:dTDP-glucose 4,6-dehydratase [Candidatus Neomarinimicrobiota bacterium]